MMKTIRRLIGFTLLLTCSTLTLLPQVQPAPVPRRADLSTHAYLFTARVTDDGGVTPFKVGSVITGKLSWDSKAKPLSQRANQAVWKSRLNSISFQMGPHRFSDVGEVKLVVTRFRFGETYSFVSHDLKVPQGWEIDHTSGSDSYAILLQNAPPRNAIPNLKVPEKITLSQFVSERQLRLDFFHGVRFPGGQAKGQCTVYATIESFKPAPR